MDGCLRVIYKLGCLSSRCTTYRRRHGFRIVCRLGGVSQRAVYGESRTKTENKRENESSTQAKTRTSNTSLEDFRILVNFAHFAENAPAQIFRKSGGYADRVALVCIPVCNADPKTTHRHVFFYFQAKKSMSVLCFPGDAVWTRPW